MRNRIVLANFLLRALGLAISASPALAASGGVVYAPESPWVRPVAFEAAWTSAHGAGGDIDHCLIDVQSNRVLEPPETYRHFVDRAVNELGVPTISQIDCTFNPAYQTLVMHRVVIHRAGRAIEVPIRGRMKLLHREDRLEDQIYDGALTAVLLVEDVRPGDAVEYSYTLRGANPVLAGHYNAVWPSGGYTPLRQTHLRLVWPSSRPLRVTVRAPARAPTVVHRGDSDEYSRVLRDPQVVEAEPEVPGWFIPVGTVEFNDATSWNEVARWSTTLFHVPSELSPALRAKVAELKAGGGAMGAIRFVQDEVRYLGIEIGQNSHRAEDANVVLARRFGDCKDKSLLLVTLLRGLGYDADPALVNTERGDSTGMNGPSALEFDHAIVRFRDRRTGTTWWVDPTAGGQRGSRLADLELPPFGRALVVSDTTRGLARIEAETAPRLVTFEKHVDARDENLPATFVLKSVYYGSDANAMRLRMRTLGREKLEKVYLDYYREHYPKIESAAPLQIEDIESENRIRVEERYTIPDFWTREKGASGTSAVCSAYEMQDYVPAWDGPKRTMPLELPGPYRVIYTTVIESKDVTSATPEVENLAIPGLRLDSRRYTEGDSYRHSIEINSDGRVLTPQQAVAAVEKLKAMRLELTLEIAPDAASGGAKEAVNTLIALFLAMLGVALGAVVAVIVYRAPSPETFWDRPEFAAGSVPWIPGQPIGGWLYALGLGVLLWPFATLIQMFGQAIAVGNAPLVNARGVSWPVGFVLLEAAFSGIELSGSVLSIVLFLQRKRKFARYFVAFAGLMLVYYFVDAIGGYVIHPEPESLMRNLMPPLRRMGGLVLWSSYFARSRRVEATFVH